MSSGKLTMYSLILGCFFYTPLHLLKRSMLAFLLIICHSLVSMTSFGFLFVDIPRMLRKGKARRVRQAISLFFSKASSLSWLGAEAGTSKSAFCSCIAFLLVWVEYDGNMLRPGGL